jgi:hypothetical protein
VYIYDNILPNSSQNEKCYRKIVVEKIKPLYVQKLFFENLAVYEIMWQDMVAPDRPQMAI